jgi:hypothetical protein
MSRGIRWQGLFELDKAENIFAEKCDGKLTTTST